MAERNELVITRVFDAPRKLVFKAWSEAAHLAEWWGPPGSAIEIKKLEFRPGGAFHYRMTIPGFGEIWGLFVYREIVEPERIVFVSSFCDEDGNIILSPFFKIWPLEILNTLALVEQGGKTTMTLSGGPINATEEELEAYESMKGSMQQGFGGTFDRLDTYLAKI